MKNESLGLRLLNKLDRLSKGQHIYEVDELENDGTAEEAAEATSSEDEGDTSETLKKLRGHLYRFQEEAGAKTYAAGGALAGAAAGSALAKRAAKKAYGLDGAAKTYAAKGAEASKNVAHFANKAVAKDALSKAAKAAGDKTAAKGFAKTAGAAAGAAEKAAKGAKKFGKAVKALNQPIKAAGRAGGFKGALIGGTAAYVGKKAYDHFKK